MFKCHVCGSTNAHEELVSEVFQIDGKPVLVEKIPAQVCARCGEGIFSKEAVEKVQEQRYDLILTPPRTGTYLARMEFLHWITGKVRNNGSGVIQTKVVVS